MCLTTNFGKTKQNQREYQLTEACSAQLSKNLQDDLLTCYEFISNKNDKLVSHSQGSQEKSDQVYLLTNVFSAVHLGNDTHGRCLVTFFKWRSFQTCYFLLASF